MRRYGDKEVRQKEEALYEKSALKPKDKGSLAAPPRVAQHETLHTLNVQLQQIALETLRRAAYSSTLWRDCGNLQQLAKKATLRLDTSIKQNICRQCLTYLIDGVSSTTRIRSHKSADMVMSRKCLECSLSRRFIRRSTKSDRIKLIAAKRRRRAQRRESKVTKAKCDAFVQQHDSVVTQQSALLVLQTSTGRHSQRTRRRIAGKLAELKGQMRLKKEQRRRKGRGKRGSGESKLATQDNSTDVIHQLKATSKTKRARQKKARQKGNRLFGLPPYAERTKTATSSIDWLSESAKSTLTAEQLAALRSMRGDHVITKGLGKFGTLGAPI